MGEVKVRVDASYPFHNILQYILKLAGQYMNIDVTIIEDAPIKVGADSDSHIQLSESFCRLYDAREFDHTKWFKEEPLLYCENGKPDYLGTAFYMINCLQEYGQVTDDKLGRFLFEHSFQKKFDCLKDNLVGQYFERLCEDIFKVKAVQCPATLFLSHDNDYFHGAVTQDSLAALKQGQWRKIPGIIYREIMGVPDWMNMRDIMDIEEEYEYKSIFFWLVNRGKVKSNPEFKNADYNIEEKRVRNLITDIIDRGWENGLHKSLSNQSFQEEIENLPFEANANRNHYLSFSLPGHFDKLEEAGLDLDTSLGFADNWGFRNCYSLPFTPFNIAENRPYNFLEVPLNIMDASLFTYQKADPEKAKAAILDWVNTHSKNANLTILWHNKYFTQIKYKGYREIYTAILALAKDLGMKCLNTDALLNRYRLAQYP